ncbi:MAG: hypothetical protein RLZZ135_99 [Cyanobacteriota bacterium]|jgi:uncharacterized protein (DUF2344 family)
MMIANALPLGATSTGEIFDFELTVAIDLFRARLYLDRQKIKSRT